MTEDEPVLDASDTPSAGRSQVILLVCTVAFVLAGLVLLILGFVNNSMLLLYVSIACAVVAGVTLIVFSRRGRRAARVATDPVPDVPPPGGPDSPGPTVTGDDRPVEFPGAG